MPGFGVRAEGNFYFIDSGVQVAALAPQIVGGRSREQIEDELWDAIKDSPKASVFEEYLKQYPGGRYLARARVRLAGLKEVSRPAPVAVPPAPSSSAAGSDPETQFWNEVKASGAREYLDAYLKQYPKGKYLALAKVETKKLDERDKAGQAKEAAEKRQVAEGELHAEIRPGKVLKDCADCPEMVVIPAGSFKMWSNEFSSEQPTQSVKIGKAFALGKTEVTQRQWRSVMGSRSSGCRKAAQRMGSLRHERQRQ